MTRKTIFKIIGYYILLVGGMFLILAGANWYMLKQDAIRIGLARPDFPYTKYSQDELNKMYPQYPNENVPTTQTPEETYAKFIAALKAGDIDGAMNNFGQKNYDEHREILVKEQKKDNFGSILKILDQPIKSEMKLETIAQYRLRDKYFIEFIKDIDGIWKIESL